MRKFIFLISFILFLGISCNKDQSAVKSLDGTWEVESLTYSGKQPKEIFVKTDSANLSNCTLRRYKEIKKIWFYKCKIKTKVDCDWVGAPTNCDPDESHWCTGNIIFAQKNKGCINGSTGTDDFIAFQFRTEQKGKKLVTRDINKFFPIGYDIVSLDDKKSVFEYKNDTIAYTLTLRKVNDDKP